MTVVRELLIMFGAEVDKGSLDKTDKKIKGFAAGLEHVLTGAMLAGFGKGLLSINKMASGVEENLNVMNASFGDNSEAVIEWSESFGDAAGRNKYELQETAAVLGAVLNPMMERNQEAAAKMSIGLAQLSVDLGSFYNLADKEVLEKLRAGITGESEPLKRLGVVMNEATLAAFALSQGITKSVKSMTVAEKTTLRYQFILDQTQNAQGDAIKTAEGWANASKGVNAKLRELATTAGLKILPFMTKMANFTKTLITGFSNFTEGTHILEGALVALGAVATAIAVKMMIAFAPVIIPMLKLAAIVALIALAVDDFMTFLKGGDSVIGRFIDKVAGPGSAEEALASLKETFQLLKIIWIQDVLPALKTLKKNIGLFFDFITDVGIPALTEFGTALGFAIADAELAFRVFFGKVKTWVLEAALFLGDFKDAVVDAFNAVADLLGLETRLEKTAPKGALRTRKGGLGSTAKGVASTQKGLATRRGRLGTTALSSGFAPGQTNQISNEYNVTVQGNATTAVAGKIGAATAAAGNAINRKTLAALKQRAAN